MLLNKLIHVNNVITAKNTHSLTSFSLFSPSSLRLISQKKKNGHVTEKLRLEDSLVTEVFTPDTAGKLSKTSNKHDYVLWWRVT